MSFSSSESEGKNTPRHYYQYHINNTIFFISLLQSTGHTFINVNTVKD